MSKIECPHDYIVEKIKKIRNLFHQNNTLIQSLSICELNYQDKLKKLKKLKDIIVSDDISIESIQNIMTNIHKENVDKDKINNTLAELNKIIETQTRNYETIHDNISQIIKANSDKNNEIIEKIDEIIKEKLLQFYENLIERLEEHIENLKLLDNKEEIQSKLALIDRNVEMIKVQKELIKNAAFKVYKQTQGKVSIKFRSAEEEIIENFSSINEQLHSIDEQLHSGVKEESKHSNQSLNWMENIRRLFTGRGIQKLKNKKSQKKSRKKLQKKSQKKSRKKLQKKSQRNHKKK